jgi:type IV pilus assembly protein PilB
MPCIFGEDAVLRILDKQTLTDQIKGLRLDYLGFNDAAMAAVRRLSSEAHGMLLVTGPTGSGKSTTLYATLTEISLPSVNIITVEDPVEYRLNGINQVQVNHKAGLTFAAVLPAILRSDPDIIMIGEVRDRTTAQLAVEAALTGHLVLSTLHTNDAPSAVTRLVEMGIEPFLVGSALDCVLAQRLSRRLCEWCKVEYTPTAAERSPIHWPSTTIESPDVLWRPVGCRNCGQTGFRGRMAVTEVMPVSEQIEHLALARAPASEIRRAAIGEGMVTLRDDGLRKAARGDTTLEEVIRVTV